VDRPSNIVMVIIGCATLVPIAACLLAAWRDRRNSADATTDATERLLYVHAQLHHFWRFPFPSICSILHPFHCVIGSVHATRDEQQEAPKPQRVLVYLYSSHLLSAWVSCFLLNNQTPTPFHQP
jgi:hypothetical protein